MASNSTRFLLLFTLALLCNIAIAENKIRLSNQQLAVYEQLLNNDIPVFLQHRFRTNWMERYSEEIQSKNPELLTIEEGVDSFLIIPALNIPIDSLSDFDGNIFNYFRCGEFSLNNGEIWVFERDTLRAKFVIKISRKYGINQIYNSDFSSVLSTTNSSIFENVSFYFQVMLIDATEGVFFIPGVFIRKGNNDFKVLGHGMELYSLKDHYKIRWKSQKGFEQYIYKIIEADSLIRSSLVE